MTFYYKVLFLLICFSFLQCKQDQAVQEKQEAVELSRKKTKKSSDSKKKKRRKKKKQVEENESQIEKSIVQESKNKAEKVIEKEVKKVKSATKKKVKKEIKKPVVKKSKGEVAFFKTSHNYGRIEMGEKVEYAFKFVNKGKEPVSIENVEVSCGCTTPVFPFVPIKPGKMGSVKVLFNSENRLGPQESLITVFTDGSTPEIELSLVGEIITDIAQPFDSLSHKKDKR